MKEHGFVAVVTFKSTCVPGGYSCVVESVYCHPLPGGFTNIIILVYRVHTNNEWLRTK